MLSPVQSERTIISSGETSSEPDEDGREQYRRRKEYRSLPANVREAIDKAKAKRKHSEFYDKLKSLN